MNENRNTPPERIGKTGEIWRDVYDQEYLILRENGAICNTLVLKETANNFAMPCLCGRERYVTPSMVGFVRTAQLAEKTGHAANMADIAAAVASALGFDGAPAAPQEAPGAYDVEELLHEIRTLSVYRALYENIIDRLITANTGR